jgi:hypothetical protein
MVLEADGTYIKEFDAPTDGYTGMFLVPVGMAVAADDTIVFVDADNRRMVSIRPTLMLDLPVVASYAMMD